MKEKNQVVPDEVLSKEFLSQFKTEADVSKFLKQLHAQVLEKMLEGEMDAHLGYEKNSVTGNNTGNSRNGSYPKKIQTEHGESVISIPRDRNGQFEPIAVPKHESRGLFYRYQNFVNRHSMEIPPYAHFLREKSLKTPYSLSSLK